jgi:hypothetical protein
MLKANEANEMYLAAARIFKDNQHKLIDTMLGRANIEGLPQDIMIIYLDSTFDEQNKLKNRKEFAEKCRKELERRNEKISKKLLNLL